MVLPPHLQRSIRSSSTSASASSSSSSSSSSNSDVANPIDFSQFDSKKRVFGGGMSSSGNDYQTGTKRGRWNATNNNDYQDDNGNNTRSNKKMSKRQAAKEARELKKQKKWEQQKLQREQQKQSKQLKKQNKQKRNQRSESVEVMAASYSFEDDERRKSRAKRFERSASAARPVETSSSNAADHTMQTLNFLRSVASRGGQVNWDEVIVKGTSTSLLKDYYRLNEVPDPMTVRSEMILKKAVQSLKKKHASDVPSSKLYSFLNNQYKAIRQDLRVQHVKNEFVVDVYETHARICLEYEDIPEVNQCQTQLHELYNLGLSSVSFMAASDGGSGSGSGGGSGSGSGGGSGEAVLWRITRMQNVASSV